MAVLNSDKSDEFVKRLEEIKRKEDYKKDKAKFDIMWDKLEDLGSCDSRGGMEYKRVLATWREEGCPKPLRSFIKKHANILPDGSFPTYSQNEEDAETKLIEAEEAFVTDMQYDLKELMTKDNYSVKRLSKESGVSKKKIRKMKKDDANPKLRDVARVFYVLGVHVFGSPCLWRNK